MSRLCELARNGASLAGVGIIDIHAHLGAYGFAIPDTSAAALVRSMDRIGIERLLCSHIWCMTPHAHRGNRILHAAMQAYPGRIEGYAGLWPSSAEEVRTEAEGCLHDGFLGFKLHNSNGFPYTHPAYTPAYALAHERRLPLLFHTWGREEEFAELREIAARYPAASLLLAHAGSSNEDDYLRIAAECENVYLELTLSTAKRGLLERFVAVIGTGKIVWGSDACFLNQAQQLGKVLGAHISEQDMRAILAGNARAILGRMQRDIL